MSTEFSGKAEAAARSRAASSMCPVWSALGRGSAEAEIEPSVDGSAGRASAVAVSTGRAASRAGTSSLTSRDGSALESCSIGGVLESSAASCTGTVSAVAGSSRLAFNSDGLKEYMPRPAIATLMPPSVKPTTDPTIPEIPEYSDPRSLTSISPTTTLSPMPRPNFVSVLGGCAGRVSAGAWSLRSASPASICETGSVSAAR